MVIIGLTAARKQWDEFVERAHQGEEVILTRYGRPCARLLPLEDTEAERQDSPPPTSTEPRSD
ncbi:type II toxin-antitoxin system Phd/YefM family antitoxin [Deinococcus planocerae]|uniref:type II toxin-antitoxin system Phd/YefM family antitoxin n=1 Tax=Deinococcus planocerae TaxID=1737569 RepID=UPI000C7F2106